jgi:hypothetical protein
MQWVKRSESRRGLDGKSLSSDQLFLLLFLLIIVLITKNYLMKKYSDVDMTLKKGVEKEKKNVGSYSII